jgi:hypothetical protein
MVLVWQELSRFELALTVLASCVVGRTEVRAGTKLKKNTLGSLCVWCEDQGRWLPKYFNILVNTMSCCWLFHRCPTVNVKGQFHIHSAAKASWHAMFNSRQAVSKSLLSHSVYFVRYMFVIQRVGRCAEVGLGWGDWGGEAVCILEKFLASRNFVWLVNRFSLFMWVLFIRHRQF